MRRASLVVVLALLAGACGGPKAELSFGGKSVPVNVSFGKPAADEPRVESTPFVLAPVLGGVGVVPVAAPKKSGPAASPLPPLAPSAGCGPEDGRVVPDAEALRSVSEDVPEGDYPFRMTGKVDGNIVEGDFVRKVRRLGVGVDGTKSFSVETDVLGVQQWWYFSVRPMIDRVPGMVGLRSVETSGKGVDGRPQFSGVKPLTLLPLDVSDAATFEDATTDPRTATSFRVSGKVIGKDRVWACGAMIDAWQVGIQQEVVTPLQVIRSEITYWIATQYGGLIVQESVSWRGESGLTVVEGQYEAAINKAPGT